MIIYITVSFKEKPPPPPNYCTLLRVSLYSVLSYPSQVHKLVVNSYALHRSKDEIIYKKKIMFRQTEVIGQMFSDDKKYKLCINSILSQHDQQTEIQTDK